MFYLFAAILLLFYLTIRVIRRRLNRANINHSYSWAQIFWPPFDSTPVNIYKSLSPENKGAFWSILSSALVTIITCWLGFSIQYIVYDASQSENNKLSHYQIVDKVRPLYQELYDSTALNVYHTMYSAIGNSVVEKLPKSGNLTSEDYVTIFSGQKLSPAKEATSEVLLLRYLIDDNNWDDISLASQKCYNVSADIAPYIKERNRKELLNNNAIIYIGHFILQSAKRDSIARDSLAFIYELHNNLSKASVKQEVSLNRNYYTIAVKAYNIYTILFEAKKFSNSNGFKVDSTVQLQLLLDFFAKPLIENMSLIHNEYLPEEDKTDFRIISFLILILSLVIGYFLMRVILMRYFDKKSLSTGKLESKDGIDLDSKVVELENSIKQKDIKIAGLMTEIAEQKREREKERERDKDDMESKVSNLQTIIQEKDRTIDSLRASLEWFKHKES